MSDFETITYEEDDGIVWVTLNRPDVLNAFNQKMRDELQSVWRGMRWNDDVRVVVLTGAGDRAFCTGIDREESLNPEIQQKALDEGRLVGYPTPWTYDDPGVELGPKANDMWKPVIAAVNGMVCAGAFYLLGEVEFVIAADHATFFDTHVTYGMTAGYEPIHMSSKVPFGELARMMLLGGSERMSAQRAVPDRDGLGDLPVGGAPRTGGVGGTPDCGLALARHSGHGARALGGARPVAKPSHRSRQLPLPHRERPTRAHQGPGALRRHTQGVAPALIRRVAAWLATRLRRRSPLSADSSLTSAATGTQCSQISTPVPPTNSVPQSGEHVPQTEHWAGTTAVTADAASLSPAMPERKLDDLLADTREVGAEILQHLCGDAVGFPDQTQQHVLGADVVVTELEPFAEGQLEHLLRTRCEGDVP